MERKLYYFFVAILCAALPFAAAAGMLKGKVTDVQGDPLPFATVYVQGTTMGTAANADAYYQLLLNPGTYRVTCQYMGFQPTSFSITIKGDETETHNFSLKEQSLKMKDVVVKANAEDPAYAIIRKAIARRQFHLDQVKTFQTGIYLKGVFRNRGLPDKVMGVKIKNEDRKAASNELGWDSTGRGVLYLCEEDADFYAQGGKDRTIIRSVRESGNPYGLGIARMPSVVSFYENNVNPFVGVTPRGFVSPVSDNAIHFYKYKYEGEFRQDGYVIDKIKVTPRREYEPLMRGTIYIVEEDWAIYSLDLLATTKSSMELLDTLNVRQTYLPLQKDTWVIKDQVIYPTIKILGLDIAGYFMTVYNRQRINEVVPDSLFEDKVITSYDKGSNKKDTSYWAANRPVPLESDEGRDYAFKDSVHTKTSDPKYIDSVRRKENRFRISSLLTGGGYTYNSRKYKNKYTTNSVLNGLLNYNTVEGLNITPKLWWEHKVDTGKTLNSVMALRYGVSNTHFNAIAKTEYKVENKDWKGRYWKLGVQGGKYVFQFNPMSNVPPLYNTVTTLLQGRNYMKIYERWEGAVWFEKNYGNGFRWEAQANFQRRLPLYNTTNFTISDKYKANLTGEIPAYLSAVLWEPHNAAIVKITASYQPGFHYMQLPDYKIATGSRWPKFHISYERGIPGIAESKTDFDKWRFSVDDNMGLRLLGNLGYNIAVGGFLNKKYVSLPDMMHIADNQIVLAAPYLKSFQLAPYYMYSNTADLYTEVHLEYKLQGLLTNKIPLLRQAKWYALIGGNALYQNDGKYYAEAFVGVDNIGYRWYRFLRVDFIQSWDNLNRSMTGIRLGINFSAFPTVVNIKTTGDEW